MQRKERKRSRWAFGGELALCQQPLVFHSTDHPTLCRCTRFYWTVQHNLRSYRWPQHILESYRWARMYKILPQNAVITHFRDHPSLSRTDGHAVTHFMLLCLNKKSLTHSVPGHQTRKYIYIGHPSSGPLIGPALCKLLCSSQGCVFTICLCDCIPNGACLHITWKIVVQHLGTRNGESYEITSDYTHATFTSYCFSISYF